MDVFLSPKDFFALTVIGSIVTAVGTLLGLWVKERFLARSFERWKQERALEEVYRKYRDPLGLVADELATRCKEICTNDGVAYMRHEVFLFRPSPLSKAWTKDPHYQQHKFHSTVFRLCSFLGWLELQQEIVASSAEGEGTGSALSVLKTAPTGFAKSLPMGR